MFYKAKKFFKITENIYVKRVAIVKTVFDREPPIVQTIVWVCWLIKTGLIFFEIFFNKTLQVLKCIVYLQPLRDRRIGEKENNEWFDSTTPAIRS